MTNKKTDEELTIEIIEKFDKLSKEQKEKIEKMITSLSYYQSA